MKCQKLLVVHVLLAIGSMVCGHLTSHLALVNVASIVSNMDNSVQLNLSTTTLSKSGQFVDLSYSGFPTPSSDEWIGLYLVNDAVNKIAPIAYQMASHDPQYLTTGSGVLTVQLLNMRSNMVFYFFSGGLSQPVLVAQSVPIIVADVNEPLQGRLSLTPDPSQPLITWTTKNCSSPAMRWGSSSGVYGNTVNAERTIGYNKSDLCGAPATTVGYRDVGVFHTAIFHDLIPGQVVSYQYGDNINDVWSDEFSFIAPPLPGQDVNIIAFGDLGQASVDDMNEESTMPASLHTRNGILNNIEGVQLVTHIGDISYAMGYSSQWEYFHQQMLPITASVPYMLAIGNHERDWPNSGSARGTTDSGGECGVPYELRFPMPTSELDAPWYSFDFGVTHFIIISTEHQFDPTSPQFNFVVEDLQEINRTLTPWVIFAGHRPYYVDSTSQTPESGDQPVATELRLAFEELLFNYQVDLVFGAHIHMYQRSCPVYLGKCANTTDNSYGGPVVVNLGMAGASNSYDLELKRPDIWVVANDITHGFMTLVANTTTLTMQYREGPSTRVFDSFTLSKTLH